jgi:hypothetical protein
VAAVILQLVKMSAFRRRSVSGSATGTNRDSRFCQAFNVVEAGNYSFTDVNAGDTSRLTFGGFCFWRVEIILHIL